MVLGQHGHGAVLFVARYGDQPPAHFSLEGENGACEDILAPDEFSEERGRDVEGQVADHLKVFPEGSGYFPKIGLENVLPDECDIPDPPPKKTTFEDFDQAGILFYADHATDGFGERQCQSPETRTDFNDRDIRVESCLTDDLTDNGRVAEEMLPQSFLGPQGLRLSYRSSA